jgi:hypothetical protein
MQLIGLTGPAKSGKSTIARYLVDQYGFHEVSFAAPLKRMIAVGFDLHMHELENQATKEAPLPWLGKSPRYLLQTLGTDWGRKMVDERLWLMLAERRIARCQQLGALGCVLSDVRFDNEAQLLADRGALLWRLWRAKAIDVRHHASERGIAEHFKSQGIGNNGSFADLYKRVDELLTPLGAATS